MDLKFRITGFIARQVHDVFEAVADPDILSSYFTTGGAKGRIEQGATVTWDFADFPGAFPVEVVEVEPNQRLKLRWQANEGAEEPATPYQTQVEFRFLPTADGRTKVEVEESGWRDSPAGLNASYGNCMGWAQMLAALKAWLEHGLNLRDGAYR